MKVSNSIITCTTIFSYVVISIILGLVLIIQHDLLMALSILVVAIALLALCQNYLIRYRKIEFKTTSHRIINFICLLSYIGISCLCVGTEKDILTISDKPSELRQDLVECKNALDSFIAHENKSLDNMCDSLATVLSYKSKSDNVDAWLEKHEINYQSDLDALKVKLEIENTHLDMDGIYYAETFRSEINYLDSISQGVGLNNILYLSVRINTLRQNIEDVCRKYDEQSPIIQLGSKNDTMDIIERTKVKVFKEKKTITLVPNGSILVISLIPFIILHILMLTNYLSTFIRRYKSTDEGITL